MLNRKTSLFAMFFTALAFAACSTTVPLRSVDIQQASAGLNSSPDNVKAARLPIKLHVALYRDSRSNAPSRAIGSVKTTVFGFNTNEVVIEDNVSDIITAAMTGGFTSMGYQMVDTDDAQFEASGVVQEFSLNVAGRDELAIVVQTVLRDVKTGATVWSGVVTEKTDRFAGVMGDTKRDIFKYLNAGIATVTQKSVNAVTDSLKLVHPELFSQMNQSQPSAPGVKVLSEAPPVVQSQGQQALSPPAAIISAPESSPVTGYLSVTSKPSRAKVYVDDVYYGLSPLKLELHLGISTVRLQAEGYKIFSEKVSIRKNETTELDEILGK